MTGITFEGNTWDSDLNIYNFIRLIGIRPVRDSKGIYWEGSSRTFDQVKFLYQYCGAKSHSNDPRDAAAKFKELKRNLGFSKEGPKLIEQMWEYGKLDSKKEEIQKEMCLLSEKPVERVSEDDLEMADKEHELREKMKLNRTGATEAAVELLTMRRNQQMTEEKIKELETENAQLKIQAKEKIEEVSLAEQTILDSYKGAEQLMGVQI